MPAARASRTVAEMPGLAPRRNAARPSAPVWSSRRCAAARRPGRATSC